MTPTRSRIVRSLAAALALAALGACQDIPDPTAAPDPAPRAAEEPTEGDLPVEKIERPLEQEFAAIAAQVPAFAGYVYDETGTRLVLVTDPAQGDAALRAVDALAPAPEAAAREGGKPTGESRVVEARFTFLELRGWRDRLLEPVLGEEGVEFLDLDEAANRITVGVSTAGAAERVRLYAEKAQVPAEAVTLEDARPAVDELPTLRDRFRPLRGGYQVQFNTPAGRFNCTYGFSARHARGLVGATNSHCTSVFWGGDGTSFSQNTVAAANFIGQETYDRSAWRCIFWLFRCRYSDAALIGLRTEGDVGGIARTQFWAGGRGGVGSIAIDTRNPRLQVVGERAYPYVGMMIDKMGRTTGWTWGWVQRTGVDVYKGGGRWVLDQAYASYGSAGGDSGSPTFVWHGDRVTLSGLHWGSTGDGRHAIFSPMWNVEYDLGALATF